MSSRRLTATVYGLGVLLVLAGLGGISRLALQLEAREHRSSAEKSFNETVQLALWRMESTLLPVLNREVGTPYFYYRPFYPAEGAYTRMWEEVPPDAVLVESPLLTDPGPFVLLHFEIGPDGSFTSPQVPHGNMRDQAEASDPSMAERIVAAEGRLSTLRSFLAPGMDDKVLVTAIIDANRALADASSTLKDELSIEGFDLGGDYEARQELLEFAQRSNIPRSKAGPAGRADESKRVAKAESAAGARRESEEALGLVAGALSNEATDALARPDDSGPEVGGFRTTWRTGPAGTGGQLVMLRTVNIAGNRTVQGVWLDWPAIENLLLSAVDDLLAGASLEPVYAGAVAAAASGQRLASVPAVLDPGRIPAYTIPTVTPTRAALVVSWTAVLAAVGAIGLVLRKSTELAERRGQFVTAVTHELRTPLTTFCLYTQMLADGMVQGESDRAHYLTTLKRESRRLSGIVENVLDFARLGQPRKARRNDAIALSELIERVRPALTERADTAGMTLDISVPDPDAHAPADPLTVERILVNLVDNACKYANVGDDARIELTTEVTGSVASISVRDFGPGIAAADASRVFKPFQRARRDANQPNPGIGLGLALARGLARELGGDLTLDRPARGPGARFRLTIPVTPSLSPTPGGPPADDS